MQLFYEPTITEGQIQLSDDNQRHIIQVLRMQIADQIQLTDGKGNHCIASIAAIGKKNCMVDIHSIQHQPPAKTAINLGIAFTKNNSRMEWLLEKITEIGVTNIYPLHTKRTEQLYPKKDRLQHILVSAMCQSKQYYLAQLHDMLTLEKLIATDDSQQKYIAHCIDDEPKQTIVQLMQTNKSAIVLIGPEGDFTPEEISNCLAKNYQPITLGHTRLRTETAGLVAITLINHLIQ
jgi:16S rRNA (uracil1498-N3)-methyltransferase